MEVKVNKEIRNYTESVFFGLSLRQSVFSAAACIVAVTLYFLFRPHFGTEVLSWISILAAAPFAVLGFARYNGMSAEQFMWAWFKSEFLMPKKLLFKSKNYHYELVKAVIESYQEGEKYGNKNSQEHEPAK